MRTLIINYIRQFLLMFIATTLLPHAGLAKGWSMARKGSSHFVFPPDGFSSQALSVDGLLTHCVLLRGALKVRHRWREGFIIGPEVKKLEKERFLSNVAENSEALKKKNPDVVKLVEVTCQDLLNDATTLRSALQQDSLTVAEIKRVFDVLENPIAYFYFFEGDVRAEEWYILGHKDALAIDLLRKLHAEENQGVDKHLIAEYILHEILEKVDRGSGWHKLIIRITNQYFKRPAYTKHGETPLGKTFRQIIHARTIEFANYIQIRDTSEIWKQSLRSSLPLQRWPVEINAEGQLVSEGGVIRLSLQWKQNGHLEIIDTQEKRQEKNVDRWVRFDRSLPESFLNAIARYNRFQTTPPLQFWNAESEEIQAVLDLMLGPLTLDTKKRWLKLIKQNPESLPAALQEIQQKQSMDAFYAAGIFLVKVSPMWRPIVDAIFGQIQNISPLGLSLVYQAVKTASDHIYYAHGDSELLSKSLLLEKRLESISRKNSMGIQEFGGIMFLELFCSAWGFFLWGYIVDAIHPATRPHVIENAPYIAAILIWSSLPLVNQGLRMYGAARAA